VERDRSYQALPPAGIKVLAQKDNGAEKTMSGQDQIPQQQQQQQPASGAAAEHNNHAANNNNNNNVPSPSLDTSKFVQERQQMQQMMKAMEKQLKQVEQEKERLAAARLKEKTPTITSVAKFLQNIGGQKEMPEAMAEFVTSAFENVDDNSVASLLESSAQNWEKQQQELEVLRKASEEKDMQIQILQKKDQRWREQFEKAQEQLSQRSAFGSPTVADIFKSSLAEPASDEDQDDAGQEDGEGEDADQGEKKAGKKRKREEPNHREKLLSMLNSRPWEQQTPVVPIRGSRDAREPAPVLDRLDEIEDFNERRNYVYDAQRDDVKRILMDLHQVGGNKRARGSMPGQRIQRLNPDQIAAIRASAMGTMNAENGEEYQSLPGQ